MESPPHLLHFRVSHYNEKVRWALDWKGVPHTREALLPGFHIPRVRWLTGQHRLPVLVVGGAPLVGSNHILAELEGLHPDPPLYPSTPSDRARALEIQDYFDTEVAPALRRLFWSTYLDDAALCTRMATDGASPTLRAIWRGSFWFLKPAMKRNMGMDTEQLSRARKRLGAYFDRIEAELAGKEYLVGDRFGLADLSAAAVMTAIIRPPEFPYPLPEPWPEQLSELKQSVASREGFQWVEEIYRRHRSGSREITR
jgi:glutathione S-transferase